MNKIPTRPRALDTSKPMTIFFERDVRDLPLVSQTIPKMPSGMEKEEEFEHHLQRVISGNELFGRTNNQLVIPTPEMHTLDNYTMNEILTADYKAPRHLIHVQPFTMDQDIPDYDMDSEDEKWLNEQAKQMDITLYLFEEIMDRLEKSSEQQVVTLDEAKLLIKEQDDLVIAIYDYWLNKRLQTQHPLIPQVKTEKKDGSSANNPYVAFRKRKDKMQTRKNRKNDETSYKKMLKLKRDLSRASLLFEMVALREKNKKELLEHTIKIFEKRYQCEDFTGELLAGAIMSLKQGNIQPSAPQAQLSSQVFNKDSLEPSQASSTPRKRRKYTRVKRPIGQPEPSSQEQASVPTPSEAVSSEEEVVVQDTPSDMDDDTLSSNPYEFRRKLDCSYLQPRYEMDEWADTPWEDLPPLKKMKFYISELPRPLSKTICFARRRVGRGGRIFFDRVYLPDKDSPVQDDYLSSFPNPLPDNIPRFVPRNPSLAPPPTQQPDQAFSNMDLASFQVHQQELFEMHRKQMERLKEDHTKVVPPLTSNATSSSSISHNVTSSSPVTTLDSASVHFAVTALVNTSQLAQNTHQRTTELLANHIKSTSNNSQKENNLNNQETTIPATTKPGNNSFIQITLPQEDKSPQLPPSFRILPSKAGMFIGSQR